MPESHSELIIPVMDAVRRLKPRSVLDLGVGNGDYGLRLRQALGDDARIVGYEGWERYRNPQWHAYSSVVIGNFTEVFFADYDLVLMTDSLEHLDEQTGSAFLRRLINYNRHVIVSTPNGEFPQGAVGGNEYEVHRSTWCPQDFVDRGGEVLLVGQVCILGYFKGRKA